MGTERPHTGRFAFDDKIRRFVWNGLAVIGLVTVLAAVATVAGVVAIFNGV